MCWCSISDFQFWSKSSDQLKNLDFTLLELFKIKLKNGQRRNEMNEKQAKYWKLHLNSNMLKLGDQGLGPQPLNA